MFTDLDLVNRFHIDYISLCRWLLSVKKNYRDVIYHNWRHAFNVAQTMFSMFKTGGLQSLFGDLECLAIIIACLSHDLDHRGTNNQFQIKTMSPLVNLYSTSVLEHHHFDQCIMLLNTKVSQRLICWIFAFYLTHSKPLIEPLRRLCRSFRNFNRHSDVANVFALRWMSYLCLELFILGYYP
ncbi:unnamed protein product [Dibothriocephalus latus]|uniref:PDEase domain-containing protein n=1 Tax=Dibothriocephalus latus TaxID=60516 RepID=A0A3P7NVQ3_DIBLA|nr:unnamed protein product [Dibothriocephalus latus]